jgi:hypothetical protein
MESIKYKGGTQKGMMNEYEVKRATLWSLPPSGMDAKI